MSVLKEAFDAGKFAVTAEMAPPKGADFSEQIEVAQLLKGKVHGINVTDMQSACLKASSAEDASMSKPPNTLAPILANG